jgi:hypothetical protein
MAKHIEFFGEDPQNLDKLHPELRACVVEDGPLGGPMIKHPFVNEVFFTSWKLANQQYEIKTKRVAELLLEGKHESALWFYERPWRITTFCQWWKDEEITEEQMVEMLPHVWIDCEMPSQFGTLPLQMFRAAGFVTDVEDKSEVKDFLLPKQTVTIYRGCGLGYQFGISWTKSPGRAAWFARRFNQEKGQVWVGEVGPQEILGIFLGRGEEEVVVDPHKVKSVRRIE